MSGITSMFQNQWWRRVAVLGFAFGVVAGLLPRILG
jgi:hypothetical protein